MRDLAGKTYGRWFVVSFAKKEGTVCTWNCTCECGTIKIIRGYSLGNYEPANCRWATKTEQARNKNIYKNSKSGLSGVTWDKRIKKWAITIAVNKKHIWLGVADNIFDAAALRKSAEIDYWK